MVYSYLLLLEKISRSFTKYCFFPDAKAQLGNCEKLFAEMEKNLDSLKTEKEEYEEWKIISNSKKLLELCIIRKNRSHQIKKMERVR